MVVNVNLNISFKVRDRGKKMNGKLKLDLKLLELPKRKIYLSVGGGSFCVD